MSSQPRLILCETTSKWAVALRRQLPAEMHPVLVETRRWEACWRQARESPGSIVLLELTSWNLELVAAQLVRYRSHLPLVTTVVLGARGMASAEWLVRELGAVHVVFSSRELLPLERLIERHWKRVARHQPAVAVRPWQALPWGPAESQTRGDAVVKREPAWLVDTDFAPPHA